MQIFSNFEGLVIFHDPWLTLPQKTTLQETNISYLNKKGKSLAQSKVPGWDGIWDSCQQSNSSWTSMDPRYSIFEDTPPENYHGTPKWRFRRWVSFSKGVIFRFHVSFRRSIPSETLILLNKKRPEQKLGELRQNTTIFWTFVLGPEQGTDTFGVSAPQLMRPFQMTGHKRNSTATTTGWEYKLKYQRKPMDGAWKWWSKRSHFRFLFWPIVLYAKRFSWYYV